MLVRDISLPSNMGNANLDKMQELSVERSPVSSCTLSGFALPTFALYCEKSPSCTPKDFTLGKPNCRSVSCSVCSRLCCYVAVGGLYSRHHTLVHKDLHQDCKRTIVFAEAVLKYFVRKPCAQQKPVRFFSPKRLHVLPSMFYWHCAVQLGGDTLYYVF